MLPKSRSAPGQMRRERTEVIRRYLRNCPKARVEDDDVFDTLAHQGPVLFLRASATDRPP